MKTKLTTLLVALVAASPAFALDFATLGVVAQPVPDSSSTLLMLGAALAGVAFFAKRGLRK